MDIQLKKGVLDTCVLFALSRGESYGYKIINDLSPVIEISESTLYPILKRLEAGGCLATRTAEYGGRLRRYYSLTSLGRAKLESGKADLREIMEIYRKMFGGRL